MEHDEPTQVAQLMETTGLWRLMTADFILLNNMNCQVQSIPMP
jgi:hypothetical protein